MLCTEQFLFCYRVISYKRPLQGVGVFIRYGAFNREGVHHKMLISLGCLLDTRHLLQSGCLLDHLQYQCFCLPWNQVMGSTTDL